MMRPHRCINEHWPSVRSHSEPTILTPSPLGTISRGCIASKTRMLKPMHWIHQPSRNNPLIQHLHDDPRSRSTSIGYGYCSLVAGNEIIIWLMSVHDAGCHESSLDSTTRNILDDGDGSGGLYS